MKHTLSFLWGAATASLGFLGFYVDGIYGILFVVSLIIAVGCFWAYLFDNWDNIR